MEELLELRCNKLIHLMLEWRGLYMRALGFTQTIEFNNIFFHVSEHFVIADLSPVAYLDLIEDIQDGSVQTAVASLYERLQPLLVCKHVWRPLSPDASQRIICLDFSLASNCYIHECVDCTAYCIKFA